MRKKHLLLIVGVLILILCLAACNKNPSPTPDNTDPSITSPSDNTTNIPDETNPVDNNTLDVVMGDEFVWDKEYSQLNAVDIKLDKNWDAYITVGNNVIVSDRFTDMSYLDNYFYDNGPMSNPDNMQMSYELNWRDFYITADGVAENDLANGELYVDASTYPAAEKMFDKYNHNLVITSIRYNSYAAEFEEILAALRANKVSGDGVFGVGSTYDEVTAIIGEPTVEYADDVYEHSVLTTASYDSEKCTLSITYFSDNTDNKGFVVGFIWTPKTVAERIAQQDGYADFFSGLYSELDFDAIVGVDTTENIESPTTTTNDVEEVSSSDNTDDSGNTSN